MSEKKGKCPHEKEEWYDELCHALSLGFDLDRNSARDLICTTNEFVRIRRENKKIESMSDINKALQGRKS